tara:strand:+ start:209 stop:496 length:288 start_codon:yes stop_codon:yes gene_type:complete
MDDAVQIQLGAFEVSTTQDKGHDIEFWAKTATDRIVNIGGNAHPVIAQQAEAFKQSVFQTIVYYMQQSALSEKATLAGEMEKQGHSDMAKIIRSL